MADVTITGLPNANLPLDGTERLPMDQAGSTVDATVGDILDLVNAAAITDATAAGKALLTAADVAAQRTALELGTAATTAATDYATAAQGSLADSAVQPGDLAAVATSGAYGDLSSLPTLGTAAATDATAYATAAEGVTNGNSHDHSGGDGAQIAYASLSGTPSLGGAAALSVGTTTGTVAAGDDSRLSDARTPTAHNQAWSTITSTPTTLSGYGITDAVASDPTGITGADAVTNLVSLTQAEYDAIVSPSATTLYVITD